MREQGPVVDLFSEGGPFLLGEEASFRAWPGARGWDDVIGALEMPGALVERAEGALVFFYPEDPGPMQVTWDEGSLTLLRWFVSGAPVVFGELAPAEQSAFHVDVQRALEDDNNEVTQLGALVLRDGLVVVSWAAHGGDDLEGGSPPGDRAALDALASTSPRATRRFNDGGPALTAVRMAPGSYRVSGVASFADDVREQYGCWVRIERV